MIRFGATAAPQDLKATLINTVCYGWRIFDNSHQFGMRQHLEVGIWAACS